jgi:hypothetical protein
MFHINKVPKQEKQTYLDNKLNLIEYIQSFSPDSSQQLNHNDSSIKLFSFKKINDNRTLRRIKVIEKPQIRGRWTKEEHIKFLQACTLYGNDWRRVINFLKNILDSKNCSN